MRTISNQKYEITDMAHEEYPFLHRIRALRDICGEIRAGDIGGFVESESNLSAEPGDCAWIFDDAIAAGDAYLGGNEASTHKYISEALGKSTIDTKTHGQTKGRSGSYSTNFQISGRELLTPDEVRMLDNRYCILFIRGTRPVVDEKYELMEHPAIRYTMDGGGPPYIHHGTVEPPIPGKPLFQIDFDNEKENAAA